VSDRDTSDAYIVTFQAKIYKLLIDNLFAYVATLRKGVYPCACDLQRAQAARGVCGGTLRFRIELVGVTPVLTILRTGPGPCTSA